MKIAAISDDGATISAHFGRARGFVVFTVSDDGAISARQERVKSGHHDFAGHDHDHDHEHEHDHGGQGQHHGRNDPRGHGFGRGAAQRHATMIAPILDCDVLLARGMGQGAYLALQEAGIQVFTTDIKQVDAAVAAYLRGDLVDRPERRH